MLNVGCLFKKNLRLSVGQRFKHNRETREDAAQWYDGTVKRVDKQHDDNKTTYFVT